MAGVGLARKTATNDLCQPAQVYASVHGDADDAGWQPNDRVLVRLADELHDTDSIGDALWADLRAAFSEEAILQLLLMASSYRTVAYLANGLRLPLEPNIGRPFPVAHEKVSMVLDGRTGV